MWLKLLKSVALVSGCSLSSSSSQIQRSLAGMMRTCNMSAVIATTVVILKCIATVNGEYGSLSPPVQVRINWGQVRAESFMVRWKVEPEVASCNLFLYEGYTSNMIGNVSGVTGDRYWFKGLRTGVVYDVRVQNVASDGQVSELSRLARTKTFGTTTTTTTTTPAPTAPTPVGACGLGYFTCETNNTECIAESWWCDGNMDCIDGTDERNCPGACPEITAFHEHGNFSCSRWNSRKSACFFQCNGDYVRDGPYYTVCVHDRWTLDVPTCRLRRPSSIRVLSDEAKTTEMMIEFEHIVSAADYQLTKLTTVSGEKPVDVKMNWSRSNMTVHATVDGLMAGKVYKGSLAAVDYTGVVGLLSRPFFSGTLLSTSEDVKGKDD